MLLSSRLNSSTCHLSKLAVFPVRKSPILCTKPAVLNSAVRDASSYSAQSFRSRRSRKSRKTRNGRSLNIQEINERIDSFLEPVGEALAKLSTRRAVKDAEEVYDTISAPNPVFSKTTKSGTMRKNLNDFTATIRESLGAPPNRSPSANIPVLLESCQKPGNGTENKDAASLAVECQQVCEDVTEDIGEISIDHFNSVMRANVIAKNPKEVESAFALIEAAGFQPNLDSFNMLLQAHAFTGDIASARKTMQNLKDAGYIPDDRSYYFLMNVYTKNDYIDEAYKVYGSMRAAGIQPTQDIFGTLIKGAASIGDHQRAWATWDRMRYEGWMANTENFEMMINVCSMTKETERALNLFQELIEQGLNPTEDTFNQAIRACSVRKDFSTDAFQLVAQMLRSGHSVNKETLTSLFLVCSYVGDLGRTRGLFFEGMISRGYENDALRPNARAMTNLFKAYREYRPHKHAKIAKQYASPVSKIDEEKQPSSTSTSLVEVDENLIYPRSVQAFSFLKECLPKTRSGVIDEATKILRLVTGVQPISSLGPKTDGSMTEDVVSGEFKVVPTTPLLNSFLSVLFAHSMVSEVTPYSTAAMGLFGEYQSRYGVEPDGHTYRVILSELTQPIIRIVAPGFKSLSSIERHRVQQLRVEKACELFEEWKLWKDVREAADAPQSESEAKETNSEELVVRSKAELAGIKNREGRGEIQVFQMYQSIVNGAARIGNVPQAMKYLSEYRTLYDPAPSINDYGDLYAACIEDDYSRLRLLNVCCGEATALEKAKDELANKWYGSFGKKRMSESKRLERIEEIMREQEKNKWVKSREQEIIKVRAMQASQRDPESEECDMERVETTFGVTKKWQLFRHHSADGF